VFGISTVEECEALVVAAGSRHNTLHTGLFRLGYMHLTSLVRAQVTAKLQLPKPQLI